MVAIFLNFIEKKYEFKFAGEIGENIFMCLVCKGRGKTFGQRWAKLLL